MPIRKVSGGYKWGSSGKVYKARAGAERQAAAAYASGYKGADKKSAGGFVSTGNDIADLAIIRGAKNIDDGTGGRSTSRMKEGGKTKSRVNEAGNYTKPEMRKRIFNEVKAGGKGGKPGQWSARKAQMLAKRYKDAGGGYRN
jgi:hypothetical protein